MGIYGGAGLRGSDATAYKSLQAIAIGLFLILAVGILKLGVAAYIAFAFSGSFLIFLTGRPSKRDILISAALGFAFAIVYHLHHGASGSYFGSEFATPCAFLGMGAVQFRAIRWICAPELEKRSTFTDMVRCALIPLLCMGSMIAVDLAAQWTPITYDRVIFAFDLHLDGGAPSWKVGVFIPHASLAVFRVRARLQQPALGPVRLLGASMARSN